MCTSFATVGPSISFGIADAVTIFSHDVALADAWATAVCNALRPYDRSVLGRIDSREVDGVFAIMGDVTVTWGVLPPLMPAVVDEQLISAGDRQQISPMIIRIFFITHHQEFFLLATGMMAFSPG